MPDAAPSSHAPPPPLTRRTVAIALIVSVASFMQMLDSSVIAVALPRMAPGFGVTPVEIGIGITVYVLAAAAVLPAGPWLADRIGARTLFVSALLGFVLTSLLCGLSSSLPAFGAARFAQGAAGALMGPVGQLLLLRSIERRDVLRVMNIASAPMLVAPVLGPPLGGVITSYLGWSWIFFLNIPIGLIGVALALWLLPNPREPRGPLDVAGLAMSALTLAPLIFGLGEVGGVGVPRVLSVGLILFALLMGALTIRHLRRAANPIFSLAPAATQSFRLTTLGGAPLLRLPVNALPFVLPILLQTGFGFSAFLSGLLFLGHTGGDLMMKMLTNRVFRAFGHRAVLIASAGVMCAGIAACATFTATTPYAVMMALLFVSGSARSFAMTGVSTLAFADIPRAAMASATTINQMGMQLASAVGTSLAIAIMDFSMTARGAGAVTPFDCRLALVLVAGLGLLAILPFARLPHEAGHEQSGYRRRAGAIVIEE